MADSFRRHQHQCLSMARRSFKGRSLQRRVSVGLCVFHQCTDKSGVPADAVIGESRSRHTRDNAFLSRKSADEKGIQISTAIIVCKSFHARRCLILYQMAFPEAVIMVSSVNCCNITKENWFETEQGISRVLGELARFGTDLVRISKTEAACVNVLRFALPRLMIWILKNSLPEETFGRLFFNWPADGKAVCGMSGQPPKKRKTSSL